MIIENFIKQTPQLTIDVLRQAFLNVTSDNINLSQSFSDNDIDDLDVIEIVIQIEKIIDISISDEILGNIDKLPILLSQFRRDERINKILS